VVAHAVSFLKEFVTKPQEVGAIVPSSRELARELVSGVDWSKVNTIIEYGPGLGAITEELVRYTQGKDFFVVELNEAYASAFEKRYPQVPLYRDSVANVGELVKERAIESVDCIVSGLPWANFSEAVQDELLDATLEVMSPRAHFATYVYIHGLFLKSGKRFREKLESRFRGVERSSIVWRNAPPAVVYHCHR
jgi:phosphatidylethanolamine/phosphatidyl-N-methylethanolamine N-methyltransferase